MADLEVGQFELDGSLLLRSKAIPSDSLSVAAFDPGDGDVRAQDADRPVGDGSMVGRDYLGAPAWTFTLNVLGSAPGDVSSAIGRVKAAWRNEQVRCVPGKTSVLRYNLGDGTRRVYGRGRKFATTATALMSASYAQIAAEFQLVDPYTYDDLEASLNLGLVTDPGEGLSWPITFPITFGATAGLRQGVVNVAGEVSTPFRAVITGPTTGHATSPFLTGNGWRVELPGLQVAYDEQVVVDMRAHTVTKNGVSVARYLSRRSTLSARLMPGSQELVFGATDPTNTASARVFWRPAHASI